MASGNPFGLSEISHYGTMQRVGGKAAGFINKKFFHPSSFRNQEKLWKAQTAHAVETRKQADMEKLRVEERQVEELRKQMYLAGQAKATDLLSFSAGASASQPSGGRNSEQKKALEEQQRRRTLLKREHAAAEEASKEGREEVGGSAAETLPGGAAGTGGSSTSGHQGPGPTAGLLPASMLASLVKSRYAEDKHIQGHGSVWGSWFATATMRWGFRCCRSTDHALKCPLAPEEPEPEGPKAKRPRGEPRGKRRRRGGGRDSAAELSSAEVQAEASAARGGIAAPAIALEESLKDGDRGSGTAVSNAAGGFDAAVQLGSEEVRAEAAAARGDIAALTLAPVESLKDDE